MRAEELAEKSLQELIAMVIEKEAVMETIKVSKRKQDEELASLRDRIRQTQMDSSRVEASLLRRLTSKEAELCDAQTSLSEYRSTTSSSGLQSALIDPAAALIITSLTKQLTLTKKQLEEAKSDLTASKFTADSQLGKRLMAKCRTLLKENAELGEQVSSGRISILNADVAMYTSYIDKVRTLEKEIDQYIQSTDSEMECLSGAMLKYEVNLSMICDACKAKLGKSEGTEKTVGATENGIDHHTSLPPATTTCTPSSAIPQPPAKKSRTSNSNGTALALD